MTAPRGITIRRMCLALISLTLIASACSGSDTVDVSDLPTAVPAPQPPGTSVDATLAPQATDQVAVVGVPDGSPLSLLALPDPTQPVAGEIPNDADSIVGGGEAFQTEDGRVWWLVRYDGVQGWALSEQIAWLARPEDATEDVIARNGGRAPTADSAASIGLLVGRLFATSEPESEVVVVQASDEVAGGGFSMVDVIDIGVDEQVGWRLRIVTESLDDGSQLQQVLKQPICRRGVLNGACRP